MERKLRMMLEKALAYTSKDAFEIGIKIEHYSINDFINREQITKLCSHLDNMSCLIPNCVDTKNIRGGKTTYEDLVNQFNLITEFMSKNNLKQEQVVEALEWYFRK